ncbi:MAG: pectate lyase precursor [Planctomycetota bacterium]
MRTIRTLAMWACGLALCATCPAGEATLPAFPGAEVFGAVASGGRGGRVIKVTTLKPRGPGSLNEAVQAKGPRIVVFDVSGVIKGHVTITQPDLTIAGQTAPGAGITIEGMLRTKYKVKPPANNIIIRFLRARPPRPKGKSHGGDCLQITNVDRLIIDHVSCSWGNDENMDLCGSKNLTVQWCAIEESDPVGHTKGYAHNFGMIMGYAGKDATVHHNLFAHHRKRAPLCGLEVLDHRNNVIYNMLLPFTFHPPRMNRSRPGKPFRVNLVANTFKAGPNVKRQMKGRSLDRLIWKLGSVEPYAKGNVCTWLGGVSELQKGQSVEKPWPAPKVQTQSAKDAFESVVGHAGCLPRDAVSKRTIREVREGTGKWARREPAGGLMEGLEPGKPPKDSDDDGMPDDWETEHKLDPNDPADAAKVVPKGASKDDRHAGYTYVEFYVNELADELIRRATRDE